VSVVVKEVNK